MLKPFQDIGTPRLHLENPYHWPTCHCICMVSHRIHPILGASTPSLQCDTFASHRVYTWVKWVAYNFICRSKFTFYNHGLHFISHASWKLIHRPAHPRANLRIRYVTPRTASIRCPVPQCSAASNVASRTRKHPRNVPSRSSYLSAQPAWCSIKQTELETEDEINRIRIAWAEVDGFDGLISHS